MPVSNANTRGVTGYCLAPADLAISKLLAAREKDLAFVSALLRHRLVTRGQITDLLAELSAQDANRVSRVLSAFPADGAS